MEREYHYSDILLLPNHSTCVSRGNINLDTQLGKYSFKMPVIPANMKTVISPELAFCLSEAGYFYIMHRFGISNKEFIDQALEWPAFTVISVSVGVRDESRADIDSWESEPQYITIDIAHGYSNLMKEMIKFVRNRFKNALIIAGNVATYDAAAYLAFHGADAIKVGVGPGHACTTKLMTGFSRPQFSAVLDCARIKQSYNNIKIIADGGIEYTGDIAKAMVAGADLVMAGHLLAGFDESPGDKIIHPDGRITKAYYGSASEHNKLMKKHIEGRRIDIPYRGSIWDRINEIKESLASSCSYAGVDKPENLHVCTKWVVQK